MLRGSMGASVLHGRYASAELIYQRRPAASKK